MLTNLIINQSCRAHRLCFEPIRYPLSLVQAWNGCVPDEKDEPPPCWVSQAIMGSKAAAEKAGSKGSVGGPSRSPTPGVSYLEVGSSVHLLEASWIASVAYNEHEKTIREVHPPAARFLQAT